MANTAYQVTRFAYQGVGQFAYQGSVDSFQSGRVRRIPREFKVESEVEKIARRLRQAATEAVEPAKTQDLSAYYRQSGRLAASIVEARTEAIGLRSQIAGLEAQAAKVAAAQQARLEHDLLIAQQGLILAAAQEAMLLEEMEAIDVAFIAAVVVTLQ